MKFTIQDKPKSQKEIKFEISAEKLQTFMNQAILKLGENIEVEGFRKGKAPKEIIEKTVGQEAILKAASQECIKDCYLKVVKEQNLEPIGQPEISILKLAPNNPFEFKATVAVLPEIAIADYKEIVPKIKKKIVEVTKEEIEKLRQEKERVEHEKLRQEILSKIADESKMEIPEILIDSEKNRMLETIKAQVPQMLGVGFEEYLKKINKTEKEIFDSFEPEALKRVKNSLVLREIQRKENFEVSEKELADEMAEIAKHNPNIDKSQLKEYTESVIKNEKTFEFLESLIK